MLTKLTKNIRRNKFQFWIICAANSDHTPKNKKLSALNSQRSTLFFNVCRRRIQTHAHLLLLGSAFFVEICCIELIHWWTLFACVVVSDASLRKILFPRSTSGRLSIFKWIVVVRSVYAIHTHARLIKDWNDISVLGVSAHSVLLINTFNIQWLGCGAAYMRIHHVRRMRMWVGKKKNWEKEKKPSKWNAKESGERV